MNIAGWRDILEAAKQKDFEAVKYFVEKKGASVATCNAENQTIAHIAVEIDHFNMFRYCIEKDPSVTQRRDKHMRSVLVRAVQKNLFSMVAHLLEKHKEDILKPHNLYYGLTIIHLAAQNGYCEMVKYFLEDLSMDCDIRNDAGETPLFLAAENVHMPVVKYLVEDVHTNVHATDENDDHVLYVSAWRGDLTVPKYLLDERETKYDLNSRDRLGETVLHRAMQQNRIVFAKYMIEQKHVNVNVMDNEGRTPLFYAVADNNFISVKYLHDRGASIDLLETYNTTALKSVTSKQMGEYLKELASKRSPRSVSALSMLPELACFHNIAPGVAAIGDGPVPLRHKLSSLSNGILIFAGLWLKYSTLSGFLRPELSPPVTPPQILMNSMDLVALEAIEMNSTFEKPRT